MLLGSEVPRLFTPPARALTPATTRGHEAVQFATEVLGVDLMPWQRWALLHALELDAAGAYRFRTVLILCARQQGKSLLLQVLALWRLYVDRAGLVIGSAQNLGMAEETWDGAVSIAEGVPDLAAEVDHVSRVNGDKWLRLTGGERYKVTTASRRGSRGLSSDLVLLDELREHHDWEAWGAATKTTMARPSPQVIGFSNAGDAQSVVLRSLRDKALSAAADSTLGLFEWSAPDACALDDPAAWQAANPALGHHVAEASIRAALETDPEPVFRTEVLCQWVDSVAPALDPAAWARLADPHAARSPAVTFALDVAPDQSTATVCASWRRDDGLVQVEVVEHAAGVEWVPGRLAALTGKWRARVVVEQTGTAAYLLPVLQQAAVTVEAVPRRFYADACSAFDAAVTAGTLRHGNHRPLDAAVAVATWRHTGEAGRVLSRKNPAVSPLVAAVLALHAAAAPAPTYATGWVMSL